MVVTVLVVAVFAAAVVVDMFSVVISLLLLVITAYLYNKINSIFFLDSFPWEKYFIINNVTSDASKWLAIWVQHLNEDKLGQASKV